MTLSALSEQLLEEMEERGMAPARVSSDDDSLRDRAAYIAEIAPARMRGRLGSLQQLAIVIGIFAALLVDYFLASGRRIAEVLWLGLEAWRWMFLAMAIPAVRLRHALSRSPSRLTTSSRPFRSPRPGRYSDGRSGARVDAKIERIRDTLASDKKAVVRRTSGPQERASCRWSGWHPPIGVPAVRRDQRDLLLLELLWQAVGFSETTRS